MNKTREYDIEDVAGNKVGYIKAKSKAQAQTRLEFTFGEDSGYTATNGKDALQLVKKTEEATMVQILNLIDNMNPTPSCAFETLGRIESICQHRLGINSMV